MKLEKRLERINALDLSRLLENKLNVRKFPRTKTEKEELLKISCVGSNLSWDSPIYTYVKYKYLKKYWMENGLWNICFTNPKRFPDPYDSLIYKVPVKMGNVFVSQELLLKDIFISCWTKCKESELHWNCYGRDEESVCIVSTPRKIMQNIYDFSLVGSYNYFFAGNVMYKNVLDVEKQIRNTSWEQYRKGEDYCMEQLFLKVSAL